MAAFSKLLKTPDKRSWATLDQIQWLVSWLPEYIEAQQSRNLHHFWPKFFAAWLKEFPLRAVTAEDVLTPEPEYNADDSDAPASSADEAAVKISKNKKKKKESKKKRQAKKAALNAKLPLAERIMGQWIEKKQGQLKTFMRWHSGATRAPRRKKGAEPASIWLTANSVDKPRRRLQETEAYIHLHYEERMAETVRERVKSSTNESGPMINVIRQVAKELYANEDDETRTAVAAYIEVRHAEALASAQLETVDPSPDQYQDAINLLPSYLETVLSEAARRTGWSFTVITGGPMPVNNGDIQTASINIGNSSTGATFKDTYRDFEVAVVRPYTEFLRAVYPSDVRASRSLSFSAEELSKESTLDSHHGGPNPTDADVQPAATPSIIVAPMNVDGDDDEDDHDDDDPTTPVDNAPMDVSADAADNNSGLILPSPPPSAALSPRLNRRVTTAAMAPIPEPSTTLDRPRPKPTAPGYKKALQERALVETAAKAKADQVTAEAAAKVEADRLAAEAAATAEATRVAAEAAANNANCLAAEAASAEADRLAGEAAAYQLAIATVAAAPPPSGEVTAPAALPLSVDNSLGAAAAAQADPSTATDRSRRKITHTAGGAEIAKQQALNEAKAKKSAETKAKNLAAKRSAEDDAGGSASRKKARGSVKGKKPVAKKSSK